MIFAARKSQGETDMPDVLAEVRTGWVASRGVQFLGAIHAAIVETLHTPEDDKVLRLVEHPPEHFAIPGSAGERYTHIEIMPAGRWWQNAHSTKRSSEISSRSACRQRT
jgi:hypothetical protein